MRNCACIFLLLLCWVHLKSQLLPGIGLTTLPSNSSSICAEPVYSGGFYSSGYQQGDTVPDFKLYDLNGDSLILSQALSGGKPALLIAGSLTCPVFRAKVATINQVRSTYSANINVYVIYTIEAHPTDTSVYFGYVNVTSQNTSAGILFASPQSYSDRKKMVDTMGAFINLNAPVYIDGPCNNWWKNFGPAPNNSYLIGTNGVVLNKHGWFNKFPDNIFCDLDSILNVNSGLCSAAPSSPGNFSLSILNASVSGAPGDLLYDFVDIVNTGSVSTVIKIKKIQKSLPAGWQTMFCADICYAANDDSIEVSVDPFDTLHFSLDFLTLAVQDSGSVKVGFKNVNKSNNSFSIWLKASTDLNNVGLNSGGHRDFEFPFYPNPADLQIILLNYDPEGTVVIHDVTGKEMEIFSEGRIIDTSHLQAGIYYLALRSPKGIQTQKLVVER